MKYPTAMSCIVDDQLSIDQRLHNNGDFLLTTATATIGGKKKWQRQRKYSTQKYMDELLSSSYGCTIM